MAGPSQSLSPGKKRPAPGSLKSEDKRVRLDDIALPNFAGSTSRDGDVQSPGTLNTLMAKQEAIQHGLEAASKIAAIINESSASKLPPQIANIREDLDSILSQHREHEVLVGLCGSSGAGKSSLINALLGMKDFLPEGHHYAMTAVVCRIAYSHRPESQKPCRAIIELQSKESVTEDLKQLLEDFRERHNLQSHSDRSLMSSEQLSHVETLDDEIRQRLDRFGPLLGLTEAGLRSDHEVCKGIEGADQLAKSFLEKEPRLTEVLCHGRIDESFASTSDLSTFAKPYLSSEAKGDDQRTFQAWPVITTVELQIPHPLLRHGIVLVDLPGRGDVNEARVAVAEEYENKLDLVLAVSPTVRAASERTMAELLSSHQKARLETNGTLGGKRIAAVVTKTDDLKMDAEIAGGPLAIAKTRQAASERSDEAARWDQRIEELQDALDTGADSLQAIRDNQQDLIMCLVRGAADINSESRTRNFDKVPPGRYVKNTMRSGSKTLKQADHLKKVAEQRRDVASLKEEFERQKLRCLQVKARNGLVRTCLLRSLNSNAGTKSPEEDETHSISVFCTSSEALWCSLAGKPLVGFPQLSHSEVPALRLWIAERAAQHSEQNLNSIFARLKTAFQLMQVWCSTEGYESQLDAPQQAKVTRQAILDADRVLCEDMKKVVAALDDSLVNVRPFPQRARARAKFVDNIKSNIQRWALKRPDQEESTERMIFGTHAAILRRKGGTYTGKDSVPHNWVNNLITIMFHPLSKGWSALIKNAVKECRTIASESIAKHWGTFLKMLKEKLDMLGLIRIVDNSVSQALATIGTTLVAEVSTEITELGRDLLKAPFQRSSENAKAVMQQHCLDCLTINGSGSFRKRRQRLEQAVPHDSGKIFDGAIGQLENYIEKRRIKAYKNVQSLVRKATGRVQITLASDRGDRRSNTVEDLRTKLMTAVSDCHGRWNFPPESPDDHPLRPVPPSLDLLQTKDLGKEHPAFKPRRKGKSMYSLVVKGHEVDPRESLDQEGDEDVVAGKVSRIVEVVQELQALAEEVA